MTTAEAIALIEAAGRPGDLFVRDGTGTYRRLARLTHPDSHPGDSRAASAFTRLAILWQRHQDGHGRLFARGDIANLYRAGPSLLKVPRDPADNDLMRAETTALVTLRTRVAPARAAYFPALVRAQRQRDPGSGTERWASVIGLLDGFRTLAEVRVAYPGGIDPRDAAWMWRRLLVAVGAAHRAGLVHGAVLPEHVMIQPDEHGLVLVDWCYSCRAPGGRIRAVVERYLDWYPPEVLTGHAAGPDLDIWLVTRCMTELVGPLMPPRMTAFARGCLLASPRRRPGNAWQLLTELDELLERLYGPRRFRPFAMPA